MAGSAHADLDRGPVHEIGARLIGGALTAVLAASPGRESAIAETAEGRSGICPESGIGFLKVGESLNEYRLLGVLGYERVARAFEIGSDVAPIQIRSATPYVLAGLISQILPYRPAEIVSRMTAGTPFLISRTQIIAIVAGGVRYAAGLNARCASGDIPEVASIDLGAFLGLRLAAERATDRGLLLSRTDNAILSALYGSAAGRTVEAISEWIGARIDEDHRPSAIEAAIGTLAWRGFVSTRREGPSVRYVLTPSGEQALRAEAAKIAALHADLQTVAA